MPEQPMTVSDTGVEQRIKVAMYGRVGRHDSDAIQCQKSFLSSEVGKHKGWEKSGLFFDVGPAAPADERPELKHLLEQAAHGEFQRVATVSVSRLARSAVQLIELVRALHEYGVEVDFLIEGLSTDGLSSKGVMKWIQRLGE